MLGCSVDVPSGISFTDGVRAQSSVAIGAEFEKGEGLSGIAQSIGDHFVRGRTRQRGRARAVRRALSLLAGQET